ncbi:hypothetical protein ACLOAV_002857 [Pseudogymnoascus australis]
MAPSFPIEHDFTFKQLDPNATPNYQHYVKLTFFFKKRSDISYEDFHKHWQTVHADLAVASKAFAKYCHRYTQYHMTPECKEKARTYVQGMEFLDFDGCSEILVDSFEDGMAFFKSEEYVQKMNSKPFYIPEILFLRATASLSFLFEQLDDESNWLARPIFIMAGYDNLIFGNRLPVPGTTDGLLLSDLQKSTK